MGSAIPEVDIGGLSPCFMGVAVSTEVGRHVVAVSVQFEWWLGIGSI